MPSEKEPFYDPVPPTYDQAVASGSRPEPGWEPPRSPLDDDDDGGRRDPNQPESQSLLRNPDAAPGSSRRPHGYHPPTVETDDEDSLWDSDSDDAEADHVRREMQEMDVEEPSRTRGSSWGKRIGFLSALPRWKWSWRPRLPRFRIPLPSRPAAEASDDAGSDAGEREDADETTTRASRFGLPKVNSLVGVIVFARLLAVAIILGFLYFLFTSNLFGSLSGHLRGGLRYNPEDLRAFLQESVDTQSMRDTVKHFSGYAHMAGTEGDYATAMDVKSMFIRAGLDEIVVDEYHVYINYPRKDGRAVQIMDESGAKAVWSAKLEEEDTHEETAGHQTLAFHGHSKSGDVKGPLIYANYGSREDYQKLKDRGIKTQGAIALVRYYGTQTDRALKVKGAELAGFAGCVIYSDPADDGFLKGEVAPKGRYMPKDGVQRGAVSLMSWVVGDVLTPGWESKKGQPRINVEDAKGLVGIPSIPLAWRDAQTLLQRLKGHGEKVADDWKGGVPDVKEWWTGDDKSPIVRLQNEQDENEQQEIWNVYGRVLGMEQDARSVILGNHRDAWGFGAIDPHTGTAVMIEVARILGELMQRGWRPLRTIELMSWDAEEYNLIGSTEYVENRLDVLRADAYAYVNLDTAVSGTQFRASGSPVMQRTLLHALNRVADPHANATLKELWDERESRLEGLGAGSDYVAFQDLAGTSSLDLEFGGEAFPYHSSYENFDLVDQVTDPGFVYHGMLAQVVGLLLLDLADREILPFDMPAYAERLKGWVEDLEKWVEGKTKGKGDKARLSFDELKAAVAAVKESADNFDKWEMDWNRLVMSSGGWEAVEVTEARMQYNDRMARFDTALLDLGPEGGIPNRTQFKHVVFGPQLWSGYDEAFFPAIRDCVDAGEWEHARHFITRTAGLLRDAAASLVAA